VTRHKIRDAQVFDNGTVDPRAGALPRAALVEKGMVSVPKTCQHATKLRKKKDHSLDSGRPRSGSADGNLTSHPMHHRCSCEDEKKNDDDMPDFSDVQSGASSTAPAAEVYQTYEVKSGDSLSRAGKG
jgi:hypothetical protein